MRRPGPLAPALALTLLVAGVAPVSARDAPSTQRRLPRDVTAQRRWAAVAPAPFGTLGGGAWDWFGDPRAV